MLRQVDDLIISMGLSSEHETLASVRRWFKAKRTAAEQDNGALQQLEERAVMEEEDAAEAHADAAVALDSLRRGGERLRSMHDNIMRRKQSYCQPHSRNAQFLDRSCSPLRTRAEQTAQLLVPSLTICPSGRYMQV